MTAQETMQPGRELDAKIYEANGHTWFECWNYEDVYDDEIGEVVRYEPLGVLEEVPHYSTDIAAAWQLVEIVYKQRGWLLDLKQYQSSRSPMDWVAHWKLPDSFTPMGERGVGTTAPHAICLAFLALSESEVKE